MRDHGIVKIDSRSFRGLENLEDLEITRGRLSEVSEGAFSSLRSLKNVNLSHNEITVLSRDTFAKCRKLQRLDLSGNPLVLPEHRPLLASLSMSALDLSFCGLSKLDDNVFSQLPALSELRMIGNKHLVVSKCIVLADMISLDVDSTTQWKPCPLQEDKSGIPEILSEEDPDNQDVPCKTQPTDDHSTDLLMSFIPTVPQFITTVVVVIVLVLLIAGIRKVLSPAENVQQYSFYNAQASEADHLTTHHSQDNFTGVV